MSEHQGVPDGWTVVSHATPAAPPQPAGTGSERTRQDTSAIGVDHEKLQQSISNWASTLPRALQGPAAAIATFPADVLASLAEMFSSPEAIATGGATPKGMAALDAVQAGSGRALDATGRLVEKIGSSLEKPARYFGAWELMHDPVKGTVTIAAPKVAQLAGRGMQKAGQALTGQAAGFSVADEAALVKQGYRPEVIQSIERQIRRGAAPAESAPAAAAPAAAGAAPATPAPTATAARPVTQATKVKLTAEEFDAAKRLVADGHDPQDVLHALVTHRAELLTPAETAELNRLVKAGKSKQAATEAIQAMKKLSVNLPTNAEVAASVDTRNVTGRWSEEP